MMGKTGGCFGKLWGKQTAGHLKREKAELPVHETVTLTKKSAHVKLGTHGEYEILFFQVWQEEQAHLLDYSRQCPMILSGDGRADSPEFSTKFGTYSVLDLQRNELIHFEVVQVSHISGYFSCHFIFYQ